MNPRGGFSRFASVRAMARRLHRRIEPVACLFALVSLTLTSSAGADPVSGDVFSYTQPDGTRVQVRVWGDEFYQVVESLDGYTLVRDPRTGAACYARLSIDGNELVSTGVPVSAQPPDGLDLQRHLRINRVSARTKIDAARARLVEREAELRAASRGAQLAGAAGIANVRGIVILVDFSDEVGTIPPSQVDDYCNLVGYSGFGNNGSVRDYYYDVSDGNVTYTNCVTPTYFRAPQPKSWYEDAPCCDRVRQLIYDALVNLDDQDFDFSEFDSNGDGYVDALNIFYAGTRVGPWTHGLWPHTGVVSFAADGVSTGLYQISDMQSELKLRTFCHENGHMLFGWPDLYDYGHESNGIGDYCLMCSGASDTNPSEPCAFLKYRAGWSTTTLLTGPQVGLPLQVGVNSFYRYDHPDRANEFYLVENRQQSARDAALPDAGLAIWHIDTAGDNDNEQMTQLSHYLVTLVQADGRWDLENNVNRGDSTDLWSAPAYSRCGPATVPGTAWWDTTPPGLYIHNISSPGPTMTFDFFSDCNVNYAADDCDLSCAGNCAGQPGCGLSADCQPDEIPDDCQLTGVLAHVPDVEPDCTATAADGDSWCDDFEGYALGAIQGNNWEGWGGDPSSRGIVTNQRNHTPGGAQSLKIADHDTVRVFTGYDPLVSNYWLLRAFVYIPAGMTGDAYFIVNPDYVDGGSSTTWAVQLHMYAGAGIIVNERAPGALPLALNQWARIECEIDFLQGEARIRYNGADLGVNSWTGGGGSLNLGAIDLFGPGSNGCFFDDIALFPLEVYTTDCDENNVPDECDILAGGDCQPNGLLDACELSGRDENNNGVLDVCDIFRPGDWNADCEVDVEDMPGVVGCLRGPEVSIGSTCRLVFDFDADDDGDLIDFAVFQTKFGAPPPGCL